MSLFKRVAVGALAATMLLSTSLTAMAHHNEFVGYHVKEANGSFVEAYKVYNEVSSGEKTGKQVFAPVADKDIDWKKGGYEAVYPYAGYDYLYLEGNKIKDVTRYNGLTPQWETRRQDYAWELAFPHTIWERQQTKVNNETWTWDFGNEKFGIADSAVYNRTVRRAVVDYKWEKYGFAIYNNEGNNLSEEELEMYADTRLNSVEKVLEDGEWVTYYNDVDGIAAYWEALLEDELSVAALSAKDDFTNLYYVTDEDIKDMIPVVYSKFVTGKFSNKNDKGLKTRDVVEEYLDVDYEGQQYDEKWDDDSLKVRFDAEISWTEPAYEMEEPYREYQYLVVNGITLDGRKDANGVERATVLRYTGGLGRPEVEWKFYFYQKLDDAEGDRLTRHVYEVVERKYVDGKKAVDENGEYILRIPAGIYGKGFYKAVEGGYEYWIAMEDGSNAIFVEFIPNFAGGVDGADWSYTGASSFYTPVVE